MSAIKPGDLVVVVKVPCPCLEDAIGTFSTVSDIDTFPSDCSVCKKPFPPTRNAYIKAGDSLGLMPVSCLKKIDPLHDLETQETRDEVPA